MNADQAKQTLETYIKDAALSLKKISIEQAVTLMLDFYRYQRVEDCSIENSGDMMLFQWGTYNWGDGLFSDFDLTRQFIIGDEGEDEDIWQLSLTFEFLPTDDLTNLGSGNRWCDNPSLTSVDIFEAFIRDSEVYKTTMPLKPKDIKLDYFNAG